MRRIQTVNTVNPRISPLGAYLFLIFLEGGLFEGGVIRGGGYTRGEAYRINVDIKKIIKIPRLF